MLLTAPWLAGTSHALENTATGSVGASVLDTASATVVLNLAGSTVDPDNSSVTVSPPNVPANGTSISTITVVLLDAANNPVSGHTVTLSSDRGIADIISQPAALTDSTGTAVGTIRSSAVGVSTITATDATDAVVLNDQPQVFFTQNVVLDLVKSANKKSEVVGGVVTYSVEVRNLTASDVGSVRIDDLAPPNFKYVSGSARLDGAVISDPTGNRPMTFNIGTVPALADSNGNGTADPGEPGYRKLSYQLVIGAGAQPGEYRNTALAWDVDPQFPISNAGEYLVRVDLDPIFDLGTIIGKVYTDMNENGVQDRGEDGIAEAMVVLDDGTYVLTDDHGRYHIPAVKPGHRLVKINRQSLPAGTVVMSGESKIVSVTPGLLVKVNFRCTGDLVAEAIGRPAGHGLSITSRDRMEPVEVKGSVGGLQVMVNGVNARLPGSDVVLGVRHLDERVDITGGRLDGPIRFTARAAGDVAVDKWRLTIENSAGEPVKVLSGEDSLPERIAWDGIMDSGEFIGGGAMYRYWLQAWYMDGGYSASARRTFGISRKDIVSLNISGLGFELGSSSLRPQTRKMLGEVAKTLRKFPNDVVVIEGHTDSTGSSDLNLRLSRERAEKTFNYLVESEGLAADRFIVQWYGESRPVASNDFPEGRDLNRRVEVKGQFLEVSMSQVLDQYRAEPSVVVNGSSLEVDEDGRFETRVSEVDKDGIDLYLAAENGVTLAGKIPVPDLVILEPRGELRLSYGESGDGYEVLHADGGGNRVSSEPAVKYRLKGQTDPGNTVRLDGRELPVEGNGEFSADLELMMGLVNAFDLLVENEEGFTRIADIHIRVTDREANGQLIVMRDPIPSLSAKLPPEGAVLHNPRLRVSGFTDPENRVWVSGESTEVDPDGRFTADIELEKGENLIRIKVLDPLNNMGLIERTVHLSEDRMFFLA
ncbi:MAG: OmpA family protein, partial [Pseudomonadota bacterium]